MLALISVLLTNQSLPTLDDVYNKVRAYPGVVIEAELLSPTSLPMTFRISPSGLMRVKYPTSEMYYGPEKTVTWMPDRRVFSESPNEPGCPVPCGFEPLWPGAKLRKQSAGTSEASFQNKPCYSMITQGDEHYPVELFVARETLQPLGTKVDLDGKSYVLAFRSVKPSALETRSLRFVPPRDARPATTGDPNANIITVGAKLKEFSAVDFSGQRTTLKKLLKGKRGLAFNFWFAGCTGCVLEMPFLRSIHAKLAGRGIDLIGVDPIDSANSALKTSKLHGLPYRTLVGPGAVKLRDQVKLGAYPVTVVVDDKGLVVDVVPFPEPDLIKKALLKLDPALKF